MTTREKLSILTESEARNADRIRAHITDRPEGQKGNDMNYKVYEVFPDGKKFFRFENEDLFECEVYVSHHKYDHKISKLVIEN